MRKCRTDLASSRTSSTQVYDTSLYALFWDASKQEFGVQSNTVEGMIFQ
jgi:hypothetical protein